MYILNEMMPQRLLTTYGTFGKVGIFAPSVHGGRNTYPNAFDYYANAKPDPKINKGSTPKPLRRITRDMLVRAGAGSRIVLAKPPLQEEDIYYHCRGFDYFDDTAVWEILYGPWSPKFNIYTVGSIDGHTELVSVDTVLSKIKQFGIHTSSALFVLQAKYDIWDVKK